ncbi:Uncharacterized protein FWK35_00029263, partial [Aphis craccivora]
KLRQYQQWMTLFLMLIMFHQVKKKKFKESSFDIISLPNNEAVNLTKLFIYHLVCQELQNSAENSMNFEKIHAFIPEIKKTENKLNKIKLHQNINKQRHIINNQFWAMVALQKKTIYFGCLYYFISKTKKNYRLTDHKGISVAVCKVLKKTMIRWFQIFLIKHLLGTLHLIQKKRSKLVPHNKYQYSYLVSEHIETYHPTISHYRREHAPNTRYLPSNINVTMMHQDFIEKYPEHSISYDFYKGKKISLANLGHEECESCEKFKLHGHNKESIEEDCDT